MTLDIFLAPRYFFLCFSFLFIPPPLSLLRYRLAMIFIVESGSMEDCVYLLMNGGVFDIDINTDSCLDILNFHFVLTVPWNCVKHL